MSANATLWASRQTVGDPITKLVLFVVSDSFDTDGTCRCSLADYASVCELPFPVFRAHIEQLISLGLMEPVRDQDNSESHPVLYRFPAMQITSEDMS